MTDAILAIENGDIFHGYSLGMLGQVEGELVFNTAMTGYQEVLTDPSYDRQLVVFTCPHIGNTGVNALDAESEHTGALAVILRESVFGDAKHWRCEQNINDYLVKRGVVGITGVDTRYLTHRLREHGAVRACLMSGPDANEQHALAAAKRTPSMVGQNLADGVSCKQPFVWAEGMWPHPQSVKANRGTIVVVDFGVKRRILRQLAQRGFKVQVVPAASTVEAILVYQAQGVLLSNGPGDPAACSDMIEMVRELLAHQVPVFGLCLGYQLLALALGGKTTKMKFGHHGANHPVLNLDSQKVMISSQNHGFVVDAASLPEDVVVTHRSLFDQTVQGFKHRSEAISGVQGHPEAGPGPNDWSEALTKWCDSLEAKHAKA